MPVFELSSALVFPSPDWAEDNGLLAIGGDLSQERLLLAYRHGIFPWYNPGDPILWWSPEPRLVLFPDKFHCSRRLDRVIRRGVFNVTFDTAFRRVIQACADMVRPGQEGTWITAEMEDAYLALHHAGYAHSVECWQGSRLVGGLYGVSLGTCFFGESMFAHVNDASKVALATLVQQLKTWPDSMIDCQMTTLHLLSLGAHELSRSEFMDKLAHSLDHPTHKGRWTKEDTAI